MVDRDFDSSMVVSVTVSRKFLLRFWSNGVLYTDVLAQ